MKFQWDVRHVSGLILAVVALVSLIIDAAGIVQIWVLREPVTQDAIRTLDLLNSTLDTTAQGLTLAKGSLKAVTITIGGLQTTMVGAAATITEASASVNALSGIVGKNLSGTITSALGTLDTVETTTRTVDDVLSGLASLPLLNIKYDPAKPLSASVADLTAQLKQVPQSLAALEKNLGSSGTSLGQVGTDAKSLASNLGEVQTELSQLVSVLEQYETEVKAFQSTVRNLRANIVTLVWSVVLFLTFVLVWIGVTMVQTLWRGLELMGMRPKWYDAPTRRSRK